MEIPFSQGNFFKWSILWTWFPIILNNVGYLISIFLKLESVVKLFFRFCCWVSFSHNHFNLKNGTRSVIHHLSYLKNDTCSVVNHQFSYYIQFLALNFYSHTFMGNILELWIFKVFEEFCDAKKLPKFTIIFS